MNWFALTLILSLSLPAQAARHSKAKKKESTSSASTKLKKVDSCAVTDNVKKVLIVKQWHLGPKTITRTFKEKYPQERNQTAIYQALAGDIKSKKIQVVVAEGCEATEINSDFKTAFNGWDYEDLHKVAQTKGYEKIITHVPLKLEARFDDEVRTLCGDNDKLIQEGNLRLSNLRGWLNFWTRLQEKYVDDKAKMYSDAAADLLKIPKDTPLPELLKQINQRMGEDLQGFKASLAERNDSFVKTLQDNAFTVAAVVIGGLHAEDLKSKIEAAGLNCEVLEPPGYQKEDEQLLVDFENAINVKKK